MSRGRYVDGNSNSRLFTVKEGRAKWRLYAGRMNGSGNTNVGTIEKIGQEGPHGEYRLTIEGSIARAPDLMSGVSWVVFGGNLNDAAKQLARREGAPVPEGDVT